MSAADEVLPLTVVPTLWEAELICQRLQDEHIPCFHRITDIGFGGSEMATTGGPREILVRTENLPRARKVLDSR